MSGWCFNLHGSAHVCLLHDALAFKGFVYKRREHFLLYSYLDIDKPMYYPLKNEFILDMKFFVFTHIHHYKVVLHNSFKHSTGMIMIIVTTLIWTASKISL